MKIYIQTILFLGFMLYYGCGTDQIITQRDCNALPIPCEKGDLYGYCHANGKVAITPKYLMALKFMPTGIAAVVDNKGWLYIDTTGKPLIRPFVVDNGPDGFHQGLARFVQNGKIGYFDTAGHIKIKAKWDFAKPFSEGLAAVCHGCKQIRRGEHFVVVGGKWGYIDEKGGIQIHPQFQDAESFTNGVAKVKYNDHWHTITPDGAIVDPLY